MDELMTTVDWSRWQFALTAIYHWLFVPLTLGLGVIVAVMESIYYRRRTERWKQITKFWMRLFGINFAIGVATGIILEFEFGTNWSNYSWFVGDIFGAPLAIEGLLAFFMEATFIAVMFFGWKKVSPRFHLTATWLTAIGASLSAWWILVANSWMQYPVGMEFDPAQMRNVMDNFWEVAFSPVAVNKFFHAVLSGWCLAGVFVVGVSAYIMHKKKNREMALQSMKVGGWVGLAGIVLTLAFGHSSAVDVAQTQPMKLAAMEGLYRGQQGTELIAVGIVNPKKTPYNDEEGVICKIAIPKGLSILANMKPDSFVPGITDILDGVTVNEAGDTVSTVSYAERIERGRQAQADLRAYDQAAAASDSAAMTAHANALKENFEYFGYGYLDSPEEAIPPVAMTFYSFHIMVALGGYFLVFFLFVLFCVYRKDAWLDTKLWRVVAYVSVPLVWLCSEAGWVTAEVGRQPWIIQNLMPNKAAVSEIGSGSVMLTFWIFVVVFTVFLVAELGIMAKQIQRGALADYDHDTDK